MLWSKANTCDSGRARHCWTSPRRGACAALVTPADWSVLFEYRFWAPDHINPAHRAILAHQTLGKPESAQSTNLMLRRQPRRPRSGFKGPSRRLNFGHLIRMPQCVSVHRPVVGPILGEPYRRAVARHLARQLVTFTPLVAPQAPIVQFKSAAVVRELKLLREPQPCANWVPAQLEDQGPPANIRALRKTCGRLAPHLGLPPATSGPSSTSTSSLSVMQ